MNSGKSVIVVGVDGSPTSAAALRWAVRQAHATGGEVRVVTAWSYAPALDPGTVRRTVEEAAKARRRALAEFIEPASRPGVDIQTEVAEGDPAEMLLAAARDADLLVVGRHGHSGVLRALLGSVSAKCLREATCPVVILPERVAAAESDAGDVLGALGYQPGPLF